MKRAPLYSGPRRNRNEPVSPDPSTSAGRVDAGGARDRPAQGRADPATSDRIPSRSATSTQGLPGRAAPDRSAWRGPPKRYPGQPAGRWPEAGAAAPSFRAGSSDDTARYGVSRADAGGQAGAGDAVDRVDSGRESLKLSRGQRWKQGLFRFALPMAGACAGVAAALGYFTLAPAGWPGSSADRATALSQEQFDEALGQSLQTVTLPSMAARAAAVVAPSVVRVRSFGPAEAPAAERAGPDRPERAAPDRAPRGAPEVPRDGGEPRTERAEPRLDKGERVDKGETPAERPANPHANPADRSAEKPADNPAEKRAERPAEKPGDKPAEKRAERGARPAPGAGQGEGRDADVQNGVGTGVVIKDDGLILSNLHVVAGARRITVVFADGTESPATIAGARPEHDLAVLKATKVPDDLQPAVLRSTGDLSEGDGVVVVGFPFDIGPSVSAGVISGFNREYQSASGTRVLSNLIQFDAAANPGNSGGPLATMEGEVVGIVTAILNPNNQRSFVGIGFAVPIESAMAAAGLPPH